MFQFIKKESRYENELQRHFVLLRWLYLLMIIYDIGFALMLFAAEHRIVYLPIVMILVLNLCGLVLTYYLHDVQNLIIHGILQFIWMTVFMVFFGWNCGIQLFIFPYMIVVFFFFFDAIPQKILFSALMFAVRMGMFYYCQLHEPLVVLDRYTGILVQSYHSLFLFVMFGVICGTFSSKIETVEQRLVHYNEKLKQQAGTDPLTGLWNRRKMEAYLEMDMKNTSISSFTIVMGDIDYFKRINDTWGHNCGDEVLIWLSNLFKNELGDKARICRWGGEEFLIYFPDQNGDMAYTYMSELRRKLNKSTVNIGGEQIHVTMTFGVEEYDFRSDMRTLIYRADEKLYRGKEEGRNTIIY